MSDSSFAIRRSRVLAMVGGVRGRVSDRLAVVVRLQVVEAVVSRKDGKLNRRVEAPPKYLEG
jgi:hypothetical protein